jgi:hypothetical protein
LGMALRDTPVSSRKQRFLEATAPKMGDLAAEYAWKMEQIKLTSPLLIGLCAVSILTKSLYPLVVVVAVGLTCSVAMFRCLVKLNRAASESLGVPINWKSGPPRRSDAYERWCREVGLSPYAAPNRFGAGKRTPA